MGCLMASSREYVTDGIEEKRTDEKDRARRLMARNKPFKNYRGPRRMTAHMSVIRKTRPARVNKYVYSLWQLDDGRVVKRRRLNPDYNA